jgi:regulator of cell morphogenesis and NO signaling
MTQSAANLVRHVLDRFHRPLRSELAAIGDLLDAEAPDETIEALRATFATLSDELLSHMQKEERVLFPHVLEMEEAAAGGRPWRSALGGITPGVVSVMMREHGSSQLALVSLRRITANFVPPEDAGPERAALYARLAAFEEELQRHIALEDGVLFPKALELERTLRDLVWASGR